MRILLLTQIIPYPPNAGPRMKTWHVLRYLVSRGHEVTLVSFIRPEEEQYLPVLTDLCQAVHAVPIKRSRIADVVYLLRSQVTGRPFLIERDDLKEMRQLVAQLVQTHSFDVVHADQLTMTQFALQAQALADENGVKRPFTIFDAHNATWTITRRMIDNVPLPLKPILRLETERIKRYEARLIAELDHTMVVIDEDQDALLAGVDKAQANALRQRFTTIPIAVDTAELTPTPRQPNAGNILTLGTLSYPPNADGIRWFLNEVFPLIQAQMPDVTLTIVGKDPPRDFLQAAAAQPDTIEVTGFVPSLDPYMAEAAVLVVPVRAGSGMRVRLLEAFARAMPTVTTTIGLEGITAEHERHLLIADEPADFARQTVWLLQDESLQTRLGENGRLLAEQKYDWQIALQKMDAVFQLAEST
jgi:polysaccharide biosynthesis protein PslH